MPLEMGCSSPRYSMIAVDFPSGIQLSRLLSETKSLENALSLAGSMQSIKAL